MVPLTVLLNVGLQCLSAVSGSGTGCGRGARCHWTNWSPMPFGSEWVRDSGIAPKSFAKKSCLQCLSAVSGSGTVPLRQGLRPHRRLQCLSAVSGSGTGTGACPPPAAATSLQCLSAVSGSGTSQFLIAMINACSLQCLSAVSGSGTSKWQTMPELMLRLQCLSAVSGSGTYAPGIKAIRDKCGSPMPFGSEWVRDRDPSRQRKVPAIRLQCLSAVSGSGTGGDLCESLLVEAVSNAFRQ